VGVLSCLGTSTIDFEIASRFPERDAILVTTGRGGERDERR
jgi:hypothetical protein